MRLVYLQLLYLANFRLICWKFNRYNLFLCIKNILQKNNITEIENSKSALNFQELTHNIQDSFQKFIIMYSKTRSYKIFHITMMSKFLFRIWTVNRNCNEFCHNRTLFIHKSYCVLDNKKLRQNAISVLVQRWESSIILNIVYS